jgi:hypothetical protein
MKRYSESKTQDEMGDMQDGVYESPTGEYVLLEDLVESVRSLVRTVHHNACVNTIRESARHWGIPPEMPRPPHPPVDTTMKDGDVFIEKDFTKP